MKGTRRFGIKGKLAPRYVGPFKIVSKRGDLAYQLELPSNFANVHDVFHVSQLRKCFKTPDRTVNFEDIELQEDLSYREHPVAILEETRTRGNKYNLTPETARVGVQIGKVTSGVLQHSTTTKGSRPEI